MSRGEVLALVLVAALAVAGVAYAVSDDVADEVDSVTDRIGWPFAMWAAIDEECPQLSAESKLLLFAHSAYESGWGTASAAVRAFNGFNTTAGPDGSKILARYLASGGRVFHEENADWEYSATPDLTLPGWKQVNASMWRRRVPQNWRAFSSWNESVRDQWDRWMMRADYGKVRAALLAADPIAYAKELRAVGYYTLDSATYANTLATILAKARAVLE